MVDQNPNLPQNDQEPFIPPFYMIILSAVGFIVALLVLLTQPTFTVIGWGGLGIGILSLVAWVFMAPEQAKAVFTGRTARFGGVSILVTIIFLAALVGIYAIVRDQNWRADLTQTDTFSLTPESRQAIAALSADPSQPSVRLIAFYGATQASRRDQDTLLFEDYATTGSPKITYEFVDPERNPALATQYNVTRPGQIAVVAVNEAGEADVANAQLVNLASQDELTNAILRVSASGDFRAYFLTVEDGLELTATGSNGMSILNESLTERYDWNTQQVTLFQLSSPDSGVTLNDPAADGEVMVIAGGSKPLTDQELQIVTDFVNGGGSLIIFASPSVTATTAEGETESSLAANLPLALAPNLSDYLYTNFGLRFVDNVVLDPAVSLQSPLVPVAITFDTTNYITSSFRAGQSGVIFDIPHSIEVAPTLPENVVVSELAMSSEQSFAKTDIQTILDGTVTEEEGDPQGPFVLAAAAENTETGARVVLFGSESVPSNQFASFGSGVVNLDVAFNSLVWSTRFNEFFRTVTIQSPVRPQDTPVFANDQVIRNVGLLTIFVIPFGILIIGILVWWNTRERAPQPVTANKEA